MDEEEEAKGIRASKKGLAMHTPNHPQEWACCLLPPALRQKRSARGLLLQCTHRHHQDCMVDQEEGVGEGWRRWHHSPGKPKLAKAGGRPFTPRFFVYKHSPIPLPSPSHHTNRPSSAHPAHAGQEEADEAWHRAPSSAAAAAAAAAAGGLVPPGVFA